MTNSKVHSNRCVGSPPTFSTCEQEVHKAREVIMDIKGKERVSQFLRLAWWPVLAITITLVLVWLFKHYVMSGKFASNNPLSAATTTLCIYGFYLSYSVTKKFLSEPYLREINGLRMIRNEKISHLTDLTEAKARIRVLEEANRRWSRHNLAIGELLALAVMLIKMTKATRADGRLGESRRIIEAMLERLVPDKIAREAALFRATTELEKESRVPWARGGF